MADLPQFTAQPGETQIRPQEGGIEAQVQAGRRIGQFYGQEGADIAAQVREQGEAAQRHITTSQMSHGMATYAAGLDTLSQEWAEFAKNSDPHDPTVRARFMAERVQPWIQQWSEGYSTEEGQKWAADRAEAFTMHFNERTAADMSTLAGVAAVQDHIQTVDSLSSAAHNDFSAMDMALGTHGAALTAATSNANLSVEGAARVNEELGTKGKAQIVMAAFRGAIERGAGSTDDPDTAMTKLDALIDNDPHVAQYLDETERNELHSYARDLVNARRSDVSRQNAEQDKADKLAYDAAKAKLEGSMFTRAADGTYQIHPPPNAASQLAALSEMPGAKFDADGVHSLQEGIVKASKDEAQGVDNARDPSTYNWFVQHAGQFTKTDVDNAFNAGKIPRDDWQTFRDQAKDGSGRDSEQAKAYEYLNSYLSKYSRAFGAAASADDPNAPPQGDPDAELRYGAFTLAARRTLDSAMQQAAGKDWHPIVDAMFDQGRPHSFVNNISTFQHGSIQAVARGWDQGSGVAPPTAGVQPTVNPQAAGESRAAYLARIANGQ